MLTFKYSVIIPVYNAERTIRRCLGSLLNQTYTDMQIVLVNDGSTDSSDAICRDYADKFRNIVYISKENGGVSSARNAGLDAATGEYVTFVDSDDYVSESYFSQLDSILDENHADFVIFSYAETDGHNVSNHIHQPFSSIDTNDYFSKIGELIYTKGINSPWNKIYRREIIHRQSIRFHRDISIGEDRLFNTQYALYCESLHVSEYPLYIVSTENENSLSRRVRNDLQEQFQKLDQATDTVVEHAPLSHKHKLQIQSAFNFCEVRSVYSDAKRMHLSGKHIAERRKFIRNKCREINAKKMTVPKSKFCTMISLPVKFVLVTAIDIVAWRLAK